MSLLKRIDAFVKIKHPDSVHYATAKDTQWINEDIIPLPPSRRTWDMWTFISFWAINNLCLSNWQTGSSLIALGLSVWMVMISTIIARVIIALVAVFNGWPGSKWHIGFPVLSRYIWGMYGHYVALIQRIVLSIIWLSTQAWTGGLCVSVILSSIFPTYQRMNNTLPSSTNMTTKEFVGFVVYCILSCFIIYIKPEKTRVLFIVFNFITFITLIGMMIWALAQAHGGGPLLSEGATVKGSSATGWAIVSGVSSVIGSIAVGLTNQSDYNRFSTSVKAPVFGQYFSIMVFGTVIPLFGCITTSAVMKIYGQAIWNPPLICAQWLEADYNAKSRAGAFFAGLGLVICQLTINTVDNVFSTGMDLAGLFPRYLNIRRGGYIGLAIGILIQPWQLLSSGSTFISVMGAYAVFLGPMTGMMICDFWLVRKCQIKLTHLFVPNKESIYWFNGGWNWRAFVSWIVGWAPILPGFINHITPSIKVPVGCSRIYELAYPYGFAVSFTVHYALNYFYPPEGLFEIDDHDAFGTFTEKEKADLGMSNVYESEEVIYNEELTESKQSH